VTHEITLNTTRQPNPTLLTEELRAAFGANLRAVTTTPDGVRVVLVAPPTPAQRQAAQDILAAHDPSGESTIEREARTSRARLAALLATDETLTAADFAGEPALTRRLARKVLLLEARLAALDRRRQEP
jgi:hypothetical protein